MTKSEKIRLDIAIFERKFANSREKARGMVMAGEVMVNGVTIDKPGTRVTSEDIITIRAKPRYVSRGGEKLAGALTDFAFDPSGRVCADVGASTGGFTDCLLQNGAARVYAIDVGYGQLDYRLRQDERVVVMERTNARYITALDELVDLAVVDASFISLRLLLPVIRGWLRLDGSIIALVKPQFEAGKEDVGKGGVVRDAHIHHRVLSEISEVGQQLHFAIVGLTRSRLKGPAGNVEYLLWLNRHQPGLSAEEIKTRIEELTQV